MRIPFRKNGKWFSRGFPLILSKHLRPPLPKVGDTRYFRMIIGSWGNFAQTRHVMSILLIAFARRYRVPVFVIVYLSRIFSFDTIYRG